MAFSRWLLGAGVALVAVAAAAQEQPDAPAEPPAKAESAPSQRLEGLEETVDALLREENAAASGQDEAAETTGAEAPPAEAAPATEAVTDESDAPAEPQPAPAPPPAPSTSAPPPPLTRAQIATLDRTVARGRLLIEIARAGIVATQDMLTRISDPNGAGIAGWIAEPAGNAVEVTFYAADGEAGAPSAVYRATVLGGRVTSREIFLGADRPPLNAIEARMTRARTASDDDALRACTDQPFNVLVVPPASGDAPIDVYRISAPAERGQVPLGGHFRSTLAADGSIESHAFANACPMIQVAPPAEGNVPPPIGVTHLADPLPTEIHMLLAQTAGRPLLVVAGDPQRLWLVTGEGIAEVRDRQSR